MADKPNENRSGSDLPGCAAEFIRQVCRKMRYGRRAREDVQAELTAHFEDGLRDCTSPDERDKRARDLVEQFGDAELLAVLCRRAKKRCRPLWRKVAIRGVQAAAGLVVYSVLCSARLFIGSPLLRVDYLAWLSDRTRAGREESLNAKPYFDKAAALMQDKELIDKALKITWGLPAEVNETQRQMVTGFVEHNAEAFELLRRGVRKPCYWVQYETAIHDPIPVGSTFPEPAKPDPAWAFNRAVAPSVSGYKRLAQAFAVSIAWRAYQGDVTGALDDCLILIDFGLHQEGRGTQVEQLVGVAIEAVGKGCAFMLLDRYEIAAPDLARVQSRLQDLYARHESPIDMAGDRAVWLALIQQTFTDNGAGNGHVLKEGLPLAARDWKDGTASLLSFGYPDRCEMTALIDSFLNEYQLALETEPSQPQFEQRNAQWKSLAEESLLLAEAAPAMDRLTHLAWRLKAGRRALLTSMAVKRYAVDKGSYPPALDALAAAGYLRVLPNDPYSGKPFGYQRTQGGFLLYGVGKDLKDDGGQVTMDRKGKPRKYADTGDWVLWPPESRGK